MILISKKKNNPNGKYNTNTIIVFLFNFLQKGPPFCKISEAPKKKKIQNFKKKIKDFMNNWGYAREGQEKQKFAMVVTPFPHVGLGIS